MKTRNKIIKNTGLGFVLLLGLISANTDNINSLKKQLKKSLDFYEESTTLYMSTEVSGVPEKNSKGLIKIGNAEIYKDGFKFYSNGFDHEMYCDGKKAFTIDRINKKATLYTNFDAKRMLKEQAIPADSLIKRISSKDSIVCDKSRPNVYKIFRNGEKRTFTELAFDEKEFFLKDFNYTIDVFGADLQSVYSQIKVHYAKVSRKLPKKIDFDLDRFIVGNGSNIRINEKLLPGYRLQIKKYYYETKVNQN